MILVVLYIQNNVIIKLNNSEYLFYYKLYIELLFNNF